jgi:hypothetical protein
MGANELDWIKTTAGSATLTVTDFLPVTSIYDAGTLFIYRQTDATSFTDGWTNIGGFSITANAVSVIPEPGAVAAIAGGLALLAGFIVRWRRHPKIASPAAASAIVE